MLYDESEPLITNETFAAFEKKASKLQLLIYLTTTRDIVGALEEIVKNEPSDTPLKQQISDFCKERKEFMRRNGHGIIYFD